jgi:hypothetical protein
MWLSDLDHNFVLFLRYVFWLQGALFWPISALKLSTLFIHSPRCGDMFAARNLLVDTRGALARRPRLSSGTVIGCLLSSIGTSQCSVSWSSLLGCCSHAQANHPDLMPTIHSTWDCVPRDHIDSDERPHCVVVPDLSQAGQASADEQQAVAMWSETR